jgi:hypothetical protein
MVVGCWGVKERGEGDLGGEAGTDGASAGGSSTTVVLCEGVWLLDETCVTVGDPAVSKSVPVPVPAHCTDRIIPARSYWASTTTGSTEQHSNRNTRERTWRGRRLRQRRGRVLGSPDHVAVAMRVSPMKPCGSLECSDWQGEAIPVPDGARVLGVAVLGANSASTHARSVIDSGVGGKRDWRVFESLQGCQRRASHDCSSNGAGRMRQCDGKGGHIRYTVDFCVPSSIDAPDWWRHQTASARCSRRRSCRTAHNPVAPETNQRRYRPRALYVAQISQLQRWRWSLSPTVCRTAHPRLAQRLVDNAP